MESVSSEDFDTPQIDNTCTTSQQSKRYLRLETAVEKASTRFISHTGYSLLTEQFPEIQKKEPDILKTKYKEFVKEFKADLMDRIKNLPFEADDLHDRLEQLQHFSNNASHSNATWRPSGNPKKDVEAHLIAVKLQHTEKLKKKLDDLKMQCSIAESVCHKAEDELAHCQKTFDKKLERNKIMMASACKQYPEMERCAIGQTQDANFEANSD